MLAAVIFGAGFASNRCVAFGAGTLLILDPIFWPLGVAMRPDLPAALFGVAAVAIAAVAKDRRFPWISLVLVVAAVMTKQSAFAGAMTLTLYLLARSLRVGMLFGGLFAAICGGLCAVLHLTSGGQFFRQVIGANLNPFSWHQVMYFLSTFVFQHPVELTAAFAILILQLRQRRLSLPALYVLVSALLSISIGKQGAQVQYLIEPLAALYLFIVLEGPELLKKIRVEARMPSIIALCVTAGFLAVVRLGPQLEPRRIVEEGVPVYEQVTEMIRKIPGDVVSDDASLLIAAGKPVIYQPFIMAQLAKAGRWDQTPMLRDLESGRILTVIARSEPETMYLDRYTPEMREVIASRFRKNSMVIQLGAIYTVYSYRGEGDL